MANRSPVKTRAGWGTALSEVNTNVEGKSHVTVLAAAYAAAQSEGQESTSVVSEGPPPAIPPAEELQSKSWSRKKLQELAFSLGLTVEEDKEIPGKQAYLAWIEKKRPPPPTPGIPPLEELQKMQRPDLQALCREHGMTEEEDDEMDEREEWIEWLEERRSALAVGTKAVHIPAREELLQKSRPELQALCKEHGMTEEEDDAMDEREDWVDWLEERRSAPAVETPAVPPVEELVRMKRKELSVLCKKHGMTEEEDDRMDRKMDFVDWLEEKRERPPPAPVPAGPAKFCPPSAVGIHRDVTPENLLLFDPAPRSPPKSSQFNSIEEWGRSHKDATPTNALTDTDAHISFADAAKTDPSPPPVTHGTPSRSPPVNPSRSPPVAPVMPAPDPRWREGDAVVVKMMKNRDTRAPLSTYDIEEYKNFKFNANGTLCKEQDPLKVVAHVVLETLKEYEGFKKFMSTNPHVTESCVMSESLGPKETTTQHRPPAYSCLKVWVWAGKRTVGVTIFVYVNECADPDTQKRLTLAEGGKAFKKARAVFEDCRKRGEISQFHNIENPLRWSMPPVDLGVGCRLVYGELVVFLNQTSRHNLMAMSAMKAKRGKSPTKQGDKDGFIKVAKK